jgi:hypothetical protein
LKTEEDIDYLGNWKFILETANSSIITVPTGPHLSEDGKLKIFLDCGAIVNSNFSWKSLKLVFNPDSEKVLHQKKVTKL